MFTIHNSQFNIFALPFARKKRDNILAELTESGIGKVYEEGRNVIVEDSRGNKTTIQFRENYRPEKVIMASGIEYAFKYDDEDRLIKFVLPGDERIEWIYKDGLLTGIGLNEVLVLFEYDEESKITAIIYPDGKKYSFCYNQFGELLKITEHSDIIIKFEVSSCNEQLIYRETDKLNSVTEYIYDEFGNIETIVFPDKKTQKFVYNETAQLTGYTNRDGSQISIDRGIIITNISYDDQNFISFFQNQYGMIEAIENENGTAQFCYSTNGFLIEETFEEITITYAYDEDNFLTKITYPSGLGIFYKYDEDGRIIVIDIDGRRCILTYLTDQLTSCTTYSNGIIELWKYKMLASLQEIKVLTKWSEKVYYTNYRYDSFFRLEKCYIESKDCAPRNIEITYDNNGSITSCVDYFSCKNDTFLYDHAGNLTQTNSTKRFTGKLNELLNEGDAEIKYNDAGNIRLFVINGKKTELSYFDSGLLKSALINTEEWNYLYDGLGRRISKCSSKERFTYTWSKEKLIKEEYQSDGKMIDREYIYLPDNCSYLGYVEAGSIYYLHKDVRGATYMVTNEAGEIVWSASYDAFGKATILLNNVRQPWRLFGHYHDAETSFDYNLGRYYSAEMKTYISSNPCWYKLYTSGYGYGLHSPYNYVFMNGKQNFPLSAGLQILSGLQNLPDFKDASQILTSKFILHKMAELIPSEKVFGLKKSINIIMPSLTGANDSTLFNCLLKEY